MRTTHAVAAGILGLVAGILPAQAQTPQRKAAATARYLTLDGVTFATPIAPQFEATLKLSLQGGKLAGASIDACIGTDPILLRVDRLSGDLDVKGDAAKGSGTTGFGGKPWSIDLKPSKAGTDWKVEGLVEYAGKAYPFHGEDITAASEPFQVDSEGEPAGDSAPDGRSLNRVDVTVPLGRIADLAGVVRERGGSLAVGRLVPGCMEIRSGKQSVTVVVAPEQAEAFVSAVNAVPGMKARIADDYSPTNRIRVAGAAVPKQYGEAGERPLADGLVAAAREAIPGASVTAQPVRDAGTGRWSVTFERPSALDDSVGLKERDTLTFVIGRSSIAADRSIVAIETLTARFVPDPAKGGRLAVEPADASGEESGDTDLATGPAIEAIRDRFARTQNGEVATGDNGEWQPLK